MNDANAHKLKEDAMELALLLYEIYKEEQEKSKVNIGQTDANDTKDE